MKNHRAIWKQLALVLLLSTQSALAQSAAAPTPMEGAEAVVGAGSESTPIAASRKKRASPPAPKPGTSGGQEAGKRFPESVKDAAETEADGKCVFCGQETTRTPGPNQRNTDHAVPRSRDGAATLNNAQNTCRDCNLEKGAKTTEEYLQEKKK